MGYEGLWEDRERLHARLAGISVPNVMKGINGQSKGIGKSLPRGNGIRVPLPRRNVADIAQDDH